MRTVRSLYALFGCALGCLAILAPRAEAQTLRIGTLDGTRNGPFTNIVDGSTTEDFRASLEDSDHLAVLGFEDVEIAGAPELTPDFLLEVDLVIIHNCFSNSDPTPFPLSGEEQDDLFQYVLDGGPALVIVDYTWTDAAQPFVEPFGLEIAGTIEAVDVSDIAAPEHLVIDGPFGVVEYIRTFWGGWFTQLGAATPLATLGANGQPSVVAIEREALGPGSGPVVLVADANPFGDPEDDPRSYFEQHEIFFLNTVAWLTSPFHSLGPNFRRGDANGDGAVDISDPIHALNWLFLGGPAPRCIAAANANGDAGVDISDSIYLLGHLFLGDPAPPAPFPDCGQGTVDDYELGCAVGNGCGFERP